MMEDIKKVDSLVDVVYIVYYFVSLDNFQIFFQEGMFFVEEIVMYLDGDGCEEVKELLCLVFFVYVIEFMCLIMCLMQFVFWLLL